LILSVTISLWSRKNSRGKVKLLFRRFLKSPRTCSAAAGSACVRHSCFSLRATQGAPIAAPSVWLPS
jgi:hypothetical protein